MRRVMTLLCMTATLSGPLLRQAEAAGDHARAVATLPDPGGTVSTPDGGVGDDTGESTLKAGDSLDVVPLWAPSCDRTADLGGLPLRPADPRPDPGSSKCRPERATWLPLGASQRHAWLQLLLI